MWKKITLFEGVLFVFLTGAMQAQGPFGLSMGMSKEQIEQAIGEPLSQREGESFAFDAPVPRPHPKFSKYVLVVTPKAGLCSIRAMAGPVETSRYGVQLRSLFTEIANQLKSVYGNYDLYDRLLSGSIWDEPEDWMSGLREKERSLQASWDSESRATLKNDIEDILLAALALRQDTGALQLQYDFTNRPQCKKEQEQAESSVF